VLIALLLQVIASDPVARPSPVPPSANEISLGLAGVAGDRRSHEFLEYRDVPQGVTVPGFLLSGHAAGFDYDLAGRDAGQDDQRFRARLGVGAVDIRAQLDDIPHRLGEGRTIFGRGAPGNLALAGALQRAVQDAVDARVASPAPLDYAFLAPLAGDVLRGGRDVRLGIERRESGLDLALKPRVDLSLSARYGHRGRDGHRLSGVGFGLRNAVEVAEPIDDGTHSVAVGAELERSWGVVSGGLQYDGYRNHLDRLVVDNPFRADDATAPGAHLGPTDLTTAAARRAEVSTLPDNDAVTANAGASVRLPLRTRVTADASFARWRQSDTLVGITTNTALAGPAAGASLPATLDGAIDIDSQTVSVTSAPWSRLSLRGRVRRYAMDNRTPRVPLPGVARLDAVFEAVPRLNVPYSHTRTRLEASVGYGLGSWRVEAGHRHEDFARTFRETEETTDAAWTAALSGPLPADGHLRLHYERAHRGFSAYDSRLSPGASRVNVHPVRSLGAGRRYDQAVRDLDRASARIELAPLPALVLAASYALDLRRYPQTAYGLVSTRAHVASADAAITPAGRWTAHAFYAFELESGFQRTRHSPLPSISIDLRDIWDARLSDRVHSVGAGIAADIAPGRTTLRLDASFQRSDGLADFFSQPGGNPDLALDIADFDDVRWLSIAAELEHRVRDGWSVAASAMWDGQQVRDVIDEDRPEYVPGAFVLAPRDFDYGAVVLQARVTRRW